jgi:hypothetical protein
MHAGGAQVAGLIVTLTVAGVFQPPDGAAAIVIHDEFEDGVKEMGVIPSGLR